MDQAGQPTMGFLSISARKSRVGWPCSTVVQLQPQRSGSAGQPTLDFQRKSRVGWPAQPHREPLHRSQKHSLAVVCYWLPSQRPVVSTALRCPGSLQQKPLRLDILARGLGTLCIKYTRSLKLPWKVHEKIGRLLSTTAKQEQCMVRSNCSQAISCRGESGP